MKRIKKASEGLFNLLLLPDIPIIMFLMDLFNLEIPVPKIAGWIALGICTVLWILGLIWKLYTIKIGRRTIEFIQCVNTYKFNKGVSIRDFFYEVELEEPHSSACQRMKDRVMQKITWRLHGYNTEEERLRKIEMPMTLGAYTAWDKVTVNANICKLDGAVCGTCGGVMMERDRAAEAEYGSKAGGGSIRVVVLRIPGEVCIGLREEFCMKITLIWNGDASLSDEERFLIYPRNYGNNVERMEVAVVLGTKSVQQRKPRLYQAGPPYKRMIPMKAGESSNKTGKEAGSYKWRFKQEISADVLYAIVL